MIIILWFLGALVCGIVGADRRIGFFGAFFIALLLSPVIGLIIAIVSKTNVQEAREKQMLEAMQRQTKITPSLSIADELAKLQQLRDASTITEDEYNTLKAKLLT